MQHASHPMSGTGLSWLILFLRGTGYEFVTPTPATYTRINNRPGHEGARLLTDIFGLSGPFAWAVLPAALFETLKESAIIREAVDGWISIVRAPTLQGETLLHSAFPTLSPDAVFKVSAALTWSGYDGLDSEIFREELQTEAFSLVDSIAAVDLTARKPGAFAC